MLNYKYVTTVSYLLQLYKLQFQCLLFACSHELFPVTAKGLRLEDVMCRTDCGGSFLDL